MSIVLGTINLAWRYWYQAKNYSREHESGPVLFYQYAIEKERLTWLITGNRSWPHCAEIHLVNFIWRHKCKQYAYRTAYIFDDCMHIEENIEQCLLYQFNTLKNNVDTENVVKWYPKCIVCIKFISNKVEKNI